VKRKHRLAAARPAKRLPRRAPRQAPPGRQSHEGGVSESSRPKKNFWKNQIPKFRAWGAVRFRGAAGRGINPPMTASPPGVRWSCAYGMSRNGTGCWPGRASRRVGYLDHMVCIHAYAHATRLLTCRGLAARLGTRPEPALCQSLNERVPLGREIELIGDLLGWLRGARIETGHPPLEHAHDRSPSC